MTGMRRVARIFLQLAADLDTVQAGQHQIQQDQARQLLACAAQPLQPVPAASSGKTLAREVVDNQLEDVRLVLNDQYSRSGDIRCHCRAA